MLSRMTPSHLRNAFLRNAFFAALSVVILSASVAKAAETYVKEAVFGPSQFPVVHGLAFDKAGNLYAGSVIQQSVMKINPATGSFERLVGWPEGQADDMEVGPDNNLVYTGIMTGKVYSLDLNDPHAKPQIIANEPPGPNPIAFRADGRLYNALTFYGDALYEIDPKGVKEPRLIIKDMGGLNGFDFGPDDKIYGPLWFKKQLVRIDADSGKIEVVADGFGTPAAANFDSKGNLYVLDTHRGEVVNVDYKTGAKKVVAQLQPGLDNLAFSPDDRMFVSNMDNAGIYEVNVNDGTTRTVVEGKLPMAADIDYANDAGRETIYVAGIFGLFKIDVATGELHEIVRQERDEFSHPVNVNVSGTELLVTSWESGMFGIFDRASGKMTSLRKGLAVPHDAVALDADNFLVSSGKENNLLRVPRDTALAPEVFAQGLEGAGPMVRVGDAVYVSETAAGKISRISLIDRSRTVIADNLRSPEGIDVLPDGRLAVAEAGDRRLLIIEPETDAKTIVADNLMIGVPEVAGLPGWIPSGVTVSPKGDIYLSSDMETAIYRFRKQ